MSDPRIVGELKPEASHLVPHLDGIVRDVLLIVVTQSEEELSRRSITKLRSRD
jgi:hypothetical protein